MKTTFSKLAVVSFAALLLASCSDSNNSNPTQAMNPSIVGSEVVSQTDAQALASRVSNYKAKVGTRTIDETNKANFEGVIDMPAAPTGVPANAVALKPGMDHSWELPTGTYYVPKGETFNPDNNNTKVGEGSVIYVEDGATLECGWYGNRTVYVLKGGTLVDTNQSPAKSMKIYNYGTLKFNSSEVIVGSNGGELYTNGDLDLTGKIFNVQGKCYIGGNLKADQLTNTGMHINIKGDCDLGNAIFKLNGNPGWTQANSFMNVDGTFTAGSMELNSGSQFYSGCSVKVTGNVNVNSGSTLNVLYMKAGSVTLSSGSTLLLKPQSFIDCLGTFADNNQDNSTSKLVGDKAVAVIKANKVTFNNGGPVWNDENDHSKGIKGYEVSVFSTPGDGSKILFDGSFFLKDDPTKDINPIFKGGNVYTQYDASGKDVVIKKSECNGNTGYKDDDKPNPTPDPDKKKDLDLITDIDYDHTHDISATCVQPYNGKMYMSYHTRGRGHGACIEVFDPVNAQKQVKLLQYFYDKAGTLDFNHLMVDQEQKRVYVVGSSSKKGAMMAYVDVKDDGLLNSEPKNITVDGGETKTYEPLNILPLQKATAEFSNWDENCIDKDAAANRYVVMTTKGYTTYDVNSLNKLETIEKPGKAKHVDIEDGKIATLFLEKEAKTTDEAINARVEVFNQGGDLNNPTSAFEVGEIQPNNGKNVLSLKNNKIYVCRGVAGIYCYDLQGNEQWHYQMPNPINEKGEYKAYANGCYVANDGLVYVAYGSYGLVVLDTNTITNGAPKVVAQRVVGHSANYVTLYNGYIYVANGRSRLQVFKLTED